MNGPADALMNEVTGDVTGGAAGAPVGLWQAGFLLGRLRLRRIVNQYRVLFRFGRKKTDAKAAWRASPVGGIFGVLALLGMLFGVASISYGNLTIIIGHAGHAASDIVPGSVLVARAMHDVTAEVTLLMIAVLLGAVASRELTRPEWDLEWLITLPLPLSTLIGSMLVERVVANAFGFMLLGAFLSMLAWKCGHGLAAPLIGFSLTLVIMFLVAAVQVLADTSLRLLLRPSALKNIQAVASLGVMVPLILVWSVSSPDRLFLLDWLPISYDWARWLPAGLAVQAAASNDAGLALGWSALLTAEVAAVVAAGSTLAWVQLHSGVVAAGVQEGTARRRPRPRSAAAWTRPAPVRTGSWSVLSAVQRRDLRLLSRDRTLLVQTFVAPVLAVGIQLLVNGGNPLVRGANWSFEPTPLIAAIAFFMAAFAIINPAFRALASEGQALWLLYTLPRSLADIVLEKVKLWGAVALIYPLALFAVIVATGHRPPVEFVISMGVVLVGVPIFALIGVSLGAFAFDPFAQEEQRKIRVSHVYIYMLLGSFYAYAIFVPGLWQRLALMILTALVALALWQKARDQFEFLLDPSASPPSRVSLSDGLIAALGFFVAQSLLVLFQVEELKFPLGGRTIWLAFCIAGAVVYGVVRLIYRFAHTREIPVFLTGGAPGALRRSFRSALGWGVLGAIPAAVCGIAYLEVIVHMGLLPSPGANPIADPALPYWLAALMIMAAPVFEEFIFRGLIFGGLRRSWGLPAAALASAAIFGLVHPALSVLPVAFMGLCAALAYELTGVLMAPMLVHALYNAAIFMFQWNVIHLWR